MEINKTLTDRKNVYGEYDVNVDARATIMTVLSNVYYGKHGVGMPADIVVKIGDIASKLVRLAASPDHKDTVHDIAGYATRYIETLGDNNEY